LKLESRTKENHVKRLFVIVAAIGLVAGACGGNDDEAGSSSAAHNQADIEFVQGMIPHHEQAVTMSEFAASRAASPGVKTLAARIQAAQAPEITQMKGFLKDWGVKEESGGMGGMSGMGGGGVGGHPGMLGADDLGRLKAAKGQEFDRMFLQGMIGHHRGAITSAEAEQAEGQASEAKALAGEIIKAQQAEIAEMEKLLTSV